MKGELLFIHTRACRGVDPYGTGGTCPPNIYEGVTSMVMSPNILEVMLFRMSARVTATVVCCILMQILCVVSQKSFSFCGTSVPQTSSLPLCPPNNPVRSTPLRACTGAKRDVITRYVNICSSIASLRSVRSSLFNNLLVKQKPNKRRT